MAMPTKQEKTHSYSLSKEKATGMLNDKVQEEWHIYDAGRQREELKNFSHERIYCLKIFLLIDQRK